MTIERIADLGTGYYLLAGRIPIYLKLSTKRKGPWMFNFCCSHQEAMQKLFLAYGDCFTCLICGRDGVVGLNLDELRKMWDSTVEEQQCISVRRRLKTMYQVKGRNGILEYKVSRRSTFDKLRIKITNKN